MHDKGVERLVHAGDTFDNDRTLVEGDKLSIAPPRDAAFDGKPEPPVLRLTDEMDRLVGTYKFNGPPFMMKVERRRNRLLYQIDPVQPFLIPLHSEGPQNFFVRGMSISFHFTNDATDDEITGVSGVGPDGMLPDARTETETRQLGTGQRATQNDRKHEATVANSGSSPESLSLQPTLTFAG